MEKEAKFRVRLAQKAYDLFERIRRGEGTSEEAHFAHYLFKAYRHSGILPTFTEDVSPAREGFFKSLISDGWLEVYQCKGEDILEAAFSEPDVKEEETLSVLDEFEILKKGEELLEKRSRWEKLTPEEERIADGLDGLKTGENVSGSVLRGLVRDRFMKRTRKGSETEFEVE